MGKSLIEQMRGEVGGPSREEVQWAFDNIGAQIDEISSIIDATGENVPEAVFSTHDVALVMLECSLQLEVLREMDAENDKMSHLLRGAKAHTLAQKEMEDSLMQTIFQTWCYLGRYNNDADDATHAKRLLQNCLLVRGSEKVKAAVKQKMLAPPPEKWWERAWVNYAYFGTLLWSTQFALAKSDFGWAAVGLFFVVWGAVDVARHAAKGGAHVQAV